MSDEICAVASAIWASSRVASGESCEGVLPEPVGAHLKQRHPLAHIVVQLSRDTGTLLVLRADQAAAQFLQPLFRPLPFGHVDARADVAAEGAVRIEAGHATIHDPAKFPVVPAQPVLHLELLPRMTGRPVGFETAFQVVRMHAGRPAVAELLCEQPAREIQPGLAEEGAQRVHARHPDRHGSGVRDQAETRFALTKRAFRALLLVEQRLQFPCSGLALGDENRQTEQRHGHQEEKELHRQENFAGTNCPKRRPSP